MTWRQYALGLAAISYLGQATAEKPFVYQDPLCSPIILEQELGKTVFETDSQKTDWCAEKIDVIVNNCISRVRGISRYAKGSLMRGDYSEALKLYSANNGFLGPITLYAEVLENDPICSITKASNSSPDAAFKYKDLDVANISKRVWSVRTETARHVRNLKMALNTDNPYETLQSLNYQLPPQK